jgi:hypothetical protein
VRKSQGGTAAASALLTQTAEPARDILGFKTIDAVAERLPNPRLQRPHRRPQGRHKPCPSYEMPTKNSFAVPFQ